jgi:hypothetical protein
LRFLDKLVQLARRRKLKIRKASHRGAIQEGYLSTSLSEDNFLVPM